MTCKLDPSEKALRSTIRQMRNIMNQMLEKKVYPTHYNIKYETDRVQMRPVDPVEIFYTGIQTISFSYHRPTLKKAKRK